MKHDIHFKEAAPSVTIARIREICDRNDIISVIGMILF